MLRIVFFLGLIAVVGLGAAWIAQQNGDIALSIGAWQIDTSLPVFVLILIVAFVVVSLAWSFLRGVWRVPARLRRHRKEKRIARGRDAITNGLIAVGTGDLFSARRHAGIARKLAQHDPLALVLQAQAAQLHGDRDGAERAFRAMAERADTRLLGLRGLFVESQRNDDPYTAVAMAEEALKIAPASPWASQAVLGFRCAKGDWDGALAILENNLAAGLIDPVAYRRQRGVLLTARALETERSDRDLSRTSIMEAAKLAPTLAPAATLAAKFLSEDNQTRRAMRVLEAAWEAQPQPDVADAYVHVRLGDSSRERLARAEFLAGRAPGNIEGALAVARAAIDASEFARARDALAPFIAAPTKRVALLMAELERAEHGDDGSARAWMLRAVRAALDPAWTADGYVSDRWRPVSPVTGRLDAFQWTTPVAALPGDKTAALESSALEEALLAPPRPVVAAADKETAAQDNTPVISSAAAVSSAPAPAELVNNAQPPVFRSRPADEIGRAASIPAVIPIVRAPDDPGVPDSAPEDDFTDPDREGVAQPGGLKGFLARLVG
ncbi:MAG: heme biosynthesis protein HemY [Bradyrhizobiaceae bacterium]|nr:MAG: heme biosynthesis protein HemY [Bradyrhizobiaceae bacterium]